MLINAWHFCGAVLAFECSYDNSPSFVHGFRYQTNYVNYLERPQYPDPTILSGVVGLILAL